MNLGEVEPEINDITHIQKEEVATLTSAESIISDSGSNSAIGNSNKEETNNVEIVKESIDSCAPAIDDEPSQEIIQNIFDTHQDTQLDQPSVMETLQQNQIIEMAEVRGEPVKQIEKVTGFPVIGTHR
eukprot:UN11603